MVTLIFFPIVITLPPWSVSACMHQLLSAQRKLVPIGIVPLKSFVHCPHSLRTIVKWRWHTPQTSTLPMATQDALRHC